MGFSIFVEMINIRIRDKRKAVEPVVLRHRVTEVKEG
jgi:hypothetical protein